MTPKWFKICDKKSDKIFYAKKGFGADGSLIAVCDPSDPHCTGYRMTPDQCRSKFYLVEPLTPKENEEYEKRFMYELHR